MLADKVLQLKGIRLELKCFYKGVSQRYPGLKPVVLSVPERLAPGSYAFAFKLPLCATLPESAGAVEYRLYATGLSRSLFSKDLFGCSRVSVSKASPRAHVPVHSSTLVWAQ